MSLRDAFLKLPLREMSPTGLVRSDIYVSVRDLSLDVSDGPRPLIANWINPYAAFVYPPFPIIQDVPNAKTAYPNLMDAVYDCFVNLKDADGNIIAYRPAVILVDDPVLQYYWQADLGNSGTVVRSVNQNTETLVHADGTEFQLVTPANHCWLNFRKGIIEFMKNQEGEKGSSLSDPAVDETIIPLVLTACMHCGVFKTKLLACGSCLGAFYCDRDCQKGGWKRHKVLCKQVSARRVSETEKKE